MTEHHGCFMTLAEKSNLLVITIYKEKNDIKEQNPSAKLQLSRKQAIDLRDAIQDWLLGEFEEGPEK